MTFFMWRFLAFFLLLMSLLSGSFILGCGYQFRASGEPLGIKLQSLAIPMIQSSSSELAFEAIFTKVFRDTFISQTDVPLLPEGKADAVLAGRIFEIREEPIAFSQTQQNVGDRVTTYSVTSRRQIIITMDAKFTIKATGKVLWHEPAMVERATYSVGTDPLVNRFNEQQAYEAIARLLASRLFLKSTERF
jgi:hypothetical protein